MNSMRWDYPEHILMIDFIAPLISLNQFYYNIEQTESVFLNLFLRLIFSDMEKSSLTGLVQILDFISVDSVWRVLFFIAMKIELTVFVAVSLFTKCPGTIRIGFGGHLITDFSQQTCIDKAKNGTTYYYWIDEGEKIPYCKSYNRQGKLKSYLLPSKKTDLQSLSNFLIDTGRSYLH